ncbi:ceramide synthase [Haematobia irritans]|uniref:TLC domain-containing protein n=2 Tax=Haematobia irritans TaxID=7368 RepID=A0A1L8EHY2_HAEIR
MVAAGLKQQLRGNRCYVSLACSIGSISLAAGSFLQIPNTTDRISLQRGLFLSSLGFIYFISLTDFCNKYLLETSHGIKFRKKYRLMMSDVLDMTNKIVSAIQASFSFLVGLIVCKSTCSKTFVYASHCLMEGYGWFGTAYFMYDIWSMYQVHTQKIADKLKLMKITSSASFTPKPLANGQSNGGLYDKHIARTFGANGKRLIALNETDTNGNDDMQHIRHHEDEIYDYDGETVQIPENGKWGFFKYVFTHPVMMIHHIFVGTVGFLVVTYIRGGGHCIYSYMFMMEFSTPFVSLRSILSTLGLKESRPYIVNGLVMLFSFFVCRVIMWPYVMWRYSVEINTTFWQAMVGLPIGCIFGILVLFLPQLYWFFLMSKGAMKVFFPTKTSKKLTANGMDTNNSKVSNGKAAKLPNGTAYTTNASLVENETT